MDRKLENLFQSLDLIEKQAVVLHDKQKYIEKLAKLTKLTYETKSYLGGLKQLDKTVEKLKENYNRIKGRCEQQQLQMLYLLEKVNAVQESKARQSPVLSKTVLEPVVEQDLSLVAPSSMVNN